LYWSAGSVWPAAQLADYRAKIRHALFERVIEGYWEQGTLRDWLDGAEHAAIKSYNYTIGTAPVKLLALLLPKDNVIPEDLPSSSA
jgi:hypothetical protein